MSRAVNRQQEQGVHLLIMRHGAAEWHVATDADRSLTALGEAEAAAGGCWLASQHLLQPAVWHSPFLRARQTAAIVLEHIGSQSCVEHPDLTPDSDPRRAAMVLQAGAATLVLCVAHQPLVGRLVSWLTAGDANAGRAFATGAIAMLRCDFPGPEGASLEWYQEPGKR